jgi:hypothetical protein
MTAIDLIAAALPPETPPESPAEGVCCVTGATCPTIARRHAILDSFTGLDLLRAPMSDRVGVAAWRVMTHSVTHHDPTKKRDLCPLRQSHWICDGRTVEYLDRQGVRKRVLNGVDAPQWAGYVTTSYKKHGSLLAPVNAGGRVVWLWETRLVDCSDRAAVADTWARLRAAQDAGIPRPLIEALDIAPGYMAKIGWRVWREFEAWARPRMLSPLYQFLTYLLPSQEELRNASAND